MVYSELEKKILLLEAKDLKEAGADGLVFGALTSEGKVDKDLCQKFIKVCIYILCIQHIRYMNKFNKYKKKKQIAYNYA